MRHPATPTRHLAQGIGVTEVGNSGFFEACANVSGFWAFPLANRIQRRIEGYYRFLFIENLRHLLFLLSYVLADGQADDDYYDEGDPDDEPPINVYCAEAYLLDG